MIRGVSEPTRILVVDDERYITDLVAMALKHEGFTVEPAATARRAREAKVQGRTVGGDDYVTKPFSLEELVARIRVVLRRQNGAGVQTSRLVVEDLELD